MQPIQMPYASSPAMSRFNTKDPSTVGAEFEAIFYRIMLQQARESGFEDEIFGGHEMDSLRQMQEEELAKKLGSAGQLGLKALVEQMAEREQRDSKETLGLLKSPL